MTKYEQLLQLAADNGVIVKEVPMAGHDGLYMDGKIAINTDLRTSAEKACVLAEELSHHFTACGDITGTSALAIKQELSGRRVAHEILVPSEKIIEAIIEGCCRSKYEIAEYLEVTEEFLEEAIQQYKHKHGLYIVHEGRILWLDPLGVLSDI